MPWPTFFKKGETMKDIITIAVIAVTVFLVGWAWIALSTWTRQQHQRTIANYRIAADYLTRLYGKGWWN